MDQPLHDPALVVLLAQRMRTQFIAMKRARLGSRYRLNASFQTDEYWERAAQYCIELVASPETLVEAVFEMYRQNRDGPWPNVMVSRPTLQRAWEQHCRLHPSTLQSSPAIMDQESGEVRWQQRHVDQDKYWNEIISGFRHIIDRAAGTSDKADPRWLNVLRDHTYPIKAWPRVMFGWPDPEIWHRFGYVAQRQLRYNLPMASWLEQHGWPANACMRATSPPEPQELIALRESGEDITVQFK